METLVKNKTIVINGKNFNNHEKEITDLLDPKGQKLTIGWSSSGPLRDSSNRIVDFGGYNKFTVEKNDRPIFFLENCYQHEEEFLRIFLINDYRNKVWDKEFSKDKEYFSHTGSSRYFSNSVSNKLDARFFEADDHKYLRFEIWQKDLDSVNLKKLGKLIEKFLKEVKNRGDKYDFEHLVHTLLLKFTK
jgi:hypothetical protein